MKPTRQSFEEWQKSQPKQTEYLRFKIGVRIYQWFGHMTHFVRDAQDQHIEDNMDKFIRDYIKHHENEKNSLDLSFSQFVGLQKGMFQAMNGICRPMRLHKKGIIGYIYKLKFNLGFKVRMLSRKYKI